jgi:hypothetical protein
MDLADAPRQSDAPMRILGFHDGRPARMEVRLVGQWSVGRRGQPQDLGQELEEALRVAQVRCPSRPVPARPVERSGQGKAQSPPLVRLVVDRAVALAELEDGHLGPAAPDVQVYDVEQTGQQAPAQDGVLERERVAGRDRPALLRPLAIGGRDRPPPGQVARVGGTDEGVRHDLVEAGPGEGLAHGLPDLERRRPPVGHGRVRQAGRDRFVAGDAGDLLGHVRFDLEVAPPARHAGDDDLAGRRLDEGGCRSARRRHGSWPVRRVAVDACSGDERPLLGRRVGRAEQSVDPRRPEGEPGLGRLVRVRIHDAGGDSTSGPLDDERGGPVGAGARQAVFLALLEAQRGLRAQAVPERRATDADRVEDGRLDDDVGGRRRDL